MLSLGIILSPNPSLALVPTTLLADRESETRVGGVGPKPHSLGGAWVYRAYDLQFEAPAQAVPAMQGSLLLPRAAFSLSGWGTCVFNGRGALGTLRAGTSC